MEHETTALFEGNAAYKTNKIQTTFMALSMWAALRTPADYVIAFKETAKKGAICHSTHVVTTHRAYNWQSKPVLHEVSGMLVTWAVHYVLKLTLLTQLFIFRSDSGFVVVKNLGRKT